LLQLANDGQAELRALMTDMRSNRLTARGLTAALASIAADVRKRNGLDVRLALGEEPDISADAKEALATIGREALHNVVKHGAAERVDIVLEYGVRGLVLVVADDGQGFDPAAPRPGHFGLQSMQERAADIGATLEVLSSEGAGTQVRVCVPQRIVRITGRPQIVA
jgi:signal transduction histidine kinase